MKTVKHIKRSNLPPNINILAPFTLFLILERFGAPLWLYGVLYTLYGIAMLLTVFLIFVGQEVDLLGNDK